MSGTLDNIGQLQSVQHTYQRGHLCVFIRARDEYVETWTPFQYPIRRLNVRSHEVSRPRDWWFKLLYRFEICQHLGSSSLHFPSPCLSVSRSASYRSGWLGIHIDFDEDIVFDVFDYCWPRYYTNNPCAVITAQNVKYHVCIKCQIPIENDI